MSKNTTQKLNVIVYLRDSDIRRVQKGKYPKLHWRSPVVTTYPVIVPWDQVENWDDCPLSGSMESI